MHIVKELIDNISSTSLNRFLTEQKIANEQRLSFSDQRVLLEQLCQSGLISVEDLNDFFLSRIIIWSSSIDARVFINCFDLFAIKEQGFVGQTYAQIPDPRLDVQPDHRDDPTEGRLHEACSDTGRKKEWKFNQGASDFCILHVKRFCRSD